MRNLDFKEVSKMIDMAVDKTGRFIDEHKVELLAGVSIAAITDNIRVRFARKKEQKLFEQSAVKQKEIARKHEAEIKVLKEESKRAMEIVQKVEEMGQGAKK